MCPRNYVIGSTLIHDICSSSSSSSSILLVVLHDPLVHVELGHISK